MTTLVLPRLWAGNSTFSGGAHAGEDTKADPGSAIAANGFYPDLGFAAEHANYQLNAEALVARRAFELAALRLRPVSQDGVTLTDAESSLAAVQRREDTPLLVIKIDGAFIVSDWSRLHATGTLTSTFDLITGAASDGTRVAVCGTDSAQSRVDYSDDDGATWTAGAAPGAVAALALYWNENKGRFILWSDNGGTARTQNSTTTVAAWSAAVSAGEVTARLAILSNGDMIVVDNGAAGGTIGFKASSDIGATYSATAGTISPSTGYADRGCVAGNNGSTIYHVSRPTGGAELRINSSADGAVWTQLATLDPPASATFNTQPVLLMCQNTGLLVVTCTTAGGQTVLYASPDGSNWVGPHCLFPIIRDTNAGPANLDTEALDVAGGRVVATLGVELFASDGVGY